MTGVEILSSAEVVIKRDFNWKAFWMAFFIILFIFVIIGVPASVLDADLNYFMISLIPGIFIALYGGFAFGDALSTPKEYATEHKAIISDEVSMNEFMGKYEIIDQEGKIYTVRARGE